MFKIWVLFFLGALLFCISSNSLAANQTVITITVQGVPCPFCINVLTKNLGKLDGVEEIQAKEDSHEFLIIMQPNKKPDALLIKKTIEDSGYISLKTEEFTLQSKGKAHMEIKNQPCSSCHTK